MRFRTLDERGQGTVEAALVIPILFLLLLMLIQPGIVLYDRMVMQGAAAEGCRVLATKTAAFGSMDKGCEAFVRHRLASIPPHECFHVREPGRSWIIELEGDESSETVSVTVENRVRPLPLFDAAAGLLGATDDEGMLRMRVSATARSQPGWAASSTLGLDPASWIGAWAS